MRTPTQMLGLVAESAVTELGHSALRPEDRADFYEGLSAILPASTSEAARYAATCIRECQRAQRDLPRALETRKGEAEK